MSYMQTKTVAKLTEDKLLHVYNIRATKISQHKRVKQWYSVFSAKKQVPEYQLKHQHFNSHLSAHH